MGAEAPNGCPAALALMVWSWLAQLGVVGDGRGGSCQDAPRAISEVTVLAWGPGGGLGREALRNEILSWDWGAEGKPETPHRRGVHKKPSS